MDLRDAYAMAEYLLEVHGLDEWEVVYDGAKRRAGICRFAERQLGLSAPLTAVHSEDDVRDTILHEIAHALVGPRHGHDERWRRVASVDRLLGGALRLARLADRAGGVARDLPRWAHPGPPPAPRAGDDLRALLQVVRPDHVYTWTHHGRPAVLHPNYVAELSAPAGWPCAWVEPGVTSALPVPR